MSAAAKYATARDIAAPTAGAGIAVVSEALGAPFMPWQQQVADVAGERWLPDLRQWRYQVVVVTVPRQAGKTTLLRAVAVHRALTTDRARVFLTAQTGKDARARWKDWVDAVTARTSPLVAHAHVRRSAGTEALTFPNASAISPFAPTPKSLHGYTPPLVMVDEVWAFDGPAGAELEAAISPAQITLPDRQLWLVSTAGDASSAWLRDWVDKGRASVGDPDSRIAYFEWSADETLDPYDPATLAFHPAVGHTQDAAALISQSQRETPGNWRRGYLNLWSSTSEALVDLAAFDDLAPETPHDPPTGAAAWISYAVAGDRSGASIWAAHMFAGAPCVHLVATRAGSAWVAPVAAQLHTAGCRLVADDAGHTRAVTATLATDGIPVATLSTAEYATASTALIAHIEDGTFTHDGSPELRAALDVAAMRPMAGGRGFDDRTSSGPIDHLKAVACAAWRAEHAPTVIPIF